MWNALFHFLEVHVRHFLVFASVVGGLLAAVGGALSVLCSACALLLGVVHLLRGGLEHPVQLVDGGVDGGDVLCLVGVLESLQGGLDGLFFVGRDFVTEFFELFFDIKAFRCFNIF